MNKIIFTNLCHESSEEEVYLDYYHPYMGGSNPSFNKFSRLILDLKDGKISSIKYFFELLNLLLRKDIPITIVPSSNPQNTSTGIRNLAILLAQEGRIDATSCLQRYQQVPKKSKGGSRNINVDLNSIKVVNQHIIKEEHILLLDDVTTTGGSLIACQRLLMQAGAARVARVALGKTQTAVILCTT